MGWRSLTRNHWIVTCQEKNQSWQITSFTDKEGEEQWKKEGIKNKEWIELEQAAEEYKNRDVLMWFKRHPSISNKAHLIEDLSFSIIVLCFSVWCLLRYLLFSLLGFKALGFLLHTACKWQNLFLISQLLKVHLLPLPEWPKFSIPLLQEESLTPQFNFVCPPFLR